MDNNKKQQQNYGRSFNVKPSLSAESNRKSSDSQVNKQRNSRRREQISTPRNEQQRHSKQQQQQQPAKLRPNVDKRPRPRAGSNTTANGLGLSNSTNDVSSCSGDDYADGSSGLASTAAYQRHEQYDYELNSIYAPGSKKQNLNHLLNFNYTPREGDFSVFGRGSNQRHYYRGHHNVGGGGVRKQRYNKEQFLQANFQFVIRSNAKPLMTASPDTLIDWSLIEQINIQTTEEPQCPICLYPPVAAKLTRCGHAYCWPCLLHYLSLSDKSWRKCPICYEAIHAVDLKSCTIMQQRAINLNDEITFQLMRRRKGSMYIERYNALNVGRGVERFPLMNKDDEAKRYSKFLIARRTDIVDLIERERRELMAEEDATCPEYVFIQQALVMLNERRDKLGLLDFKEDDENDFISKQMDETEFIKVEVNELVNNLATLELDQDSIENIEGAKETSNDKSSIEDESVGSNAIFVDETVAIPATSDANYKYYYFYQSNDGQNIYLHPLNVKMLQACYGTLDHAPLMISANILQKEQHSMDDDHRRKFTCLGHLPLTCQFAVVEVELHPPIVTVGILKLFKDDLQRRKQERQRREREERKREKHINELNDRQMGKLIASTANINLSSAYEFPTCGFEESLPSLGEERHGSASAATNAVSYSAVAIVSESPKQREFWPTIGGSFTSSTAIKSPSNELGGAWGRAAPPPPKPIVKIQQDGDIDGELRPMTTRLSDVLAEAISQKQQKNSTGNNGGGSKKQKKSKKMIPIFATGMNYNGN